MTPNEPFRVESLDHVELLVPDRYEAAAWYEKVFGLEIVAKFEVWCEPHGGPLMISSDEGRTMVALFRGVPQEGIDEAGPRLIAFRVSGEQFLAFIDRAPTLDLSPHPSLTLTRDNICNHDHSFSVYLTDPWGNRFEVTTYELKVVRDATERPLHKGFDG